MGGGRTRSTEDAYYLQVFIQSSGRFALLSLVLLGIACESRATPETATGDLSVGEAIEAARSIDGVESFALWRGGEWLIEEYFSGDADDPRHIRSGTKSVTSLLVGIALDRGLIESLDQTLGELMPEVATRFGAEKGRIRLRDLLTMSAGLEWDESDVGEFNRWVVARDPVAHYLGRPVVSPPGEVFNYASGASHILGQVVSRVSGMSLADFAESALFEPLGVDGARWERLRDGGFNGAAGLRLRTGDLVRIGRLVLHGGEWEGRRLVSKAWIERSTRTWMAASEEASYGLHWWISNLQPPAVVALGHAGQAMMVVPERDEVAVITCRWQGLERGASGRQASDVMRFLMLRRIVR